MNAPSSDLQISKFKELKSNSRRTHGSKRQTPLVYPESIRLSNPRGRAHPLDSSTTYLHQEQKDPYIQLLVGSLQQFPPLLPSAAATTPDPVILGNQPIKARATANDLIDFDQAAVDMTQLHISQASLTQNPASANYQPTQDTTNATNKVEGWLDSIGTSTKPPQEDYSRVASIYDQKATIPVVDENAPPASNGTNPTLNAKHAHITTQQATSVISRSTVLDVERYWDALQQQYVCPGNRCNRQFNQAQHFRDHLLSAAHVGGIVVCPSCLKRFRTTAAWVAHTESASKKCDIRNSVNFNMVMREITGGVLGTYGFLDDGTVNYVAPKIQDW
jgi:hypothetical protein